MRMSCAKLSCQLHVFKGQLVPTILMPAEQSREQSWDGSPHGSLQPEGTGEFQDMLKFAGCLTEGELKWLTGPKFLFLKASDILKTVN